MRNILFVLCVSLLAVQTLAQRGRTGGGEDSSPSVQIKKYEAEKGKFTYEANIVEGKKSRKLTFSELKKIYEAHPEIVDIIAAALQIQIKDLKSYFAKTHPITRDMKDDHPLAVYWTDEEEMKVFARTANQALFSSADEDTSDDTKEEDPSKKDSTKKPSTRQRGENPFPQLTDPGASKKAKPTRERGSDPVKPAGPPPSGNDQSLE